MYVYIYDMSLNVEGEAVRIEKAPLCSFCWKRMQHNLWRVNKL